MSECILTLIYVYFTVISNSYFYIKSQNGKVLHVNGTGNNGDTVQARTYDGSDNQLWSLEDKGNGYYCIRSKLSVSRCLDVHNDADNGFGWQNTITGTRLQIWVCSNNANQYWSFYSGLWNNDNIKVKDKDMCIDMHDIDYNANVSPANVQMWYCVNVGNQNWQMMNTGSPTKQPTNNPTDIPTKYPSIVPTENPSKYPTMYPSMYPSGYPTVFPTNYPSDYPSNYPSLYPSMLTLEPSKTPTVEPTQQPSNLTSNTPSLLTNVPTINPTQMPSIVPTKLTEIPTPITKIPTNTPTNIPTNIPTLQPTTSLPTNVPSIYPSNNPTIIPTQLTQKPTQITKIPTNIPSINSSVYTSVVPTNIPTNNPSFSPSITQTQITTITSSNFDELANNEQIVAILSISITILLICLFFCGIVMCYIYRKNHLQKMMSLNSTSTQTQEKKKYDFIAQEMGPNAFEARKMTQGETIGIGNEMTEIVNNDNNNENDNEIAKEIQLNENDIHGITSGNIDINNIVTPKNDSVDKVIEGEGVVTVQN